MAESPSDGSGRRAGFLFTVLILMGAGWGLAQPLSKIAVSGGYQHFGLVFWQSIIGAVVLTAFQGMRRKPFRTDRQALLVYVVIALIGTIIPNSASYEAIRHLPAGLISILLSMVPMAAFPIALALGNERFAWIRFAGLLLGLVGVLLIALPKSSLPDPAMVVFLPLALVAVFFYGLEGNVVDRWGTAGLSAVEVLHGASIIGAVLVLPLALGTGQFIDPRLPWTAPDWALVATSLIHVVVYTTYVWMIGKAGPVFAVQVSYLVTGFGVLWAMLLLGETYSGWVWSAMAVMLVAMFLVQPRQAPVATLDASGESGESS